MKKQAILGLVVLAALFGAGCVRRRRRIKIVDTTAPDAFGSTVVREWVLPRQRFARATDEFVARRWS
jgi:hypothetical protein